jgi:L,D-transpeptidase YnhG
LAVVGSSPKKPRAVDFFAGRSAGVSLSRLMGCFRDFCAVARHVSHAFFCIGLGCAVLSSTPASAQVNKATILNSGKNKNVAQRKVDLQAEAKLLHIYQLIGKGQNRQALAQSEQLLQAQPNFQLAQLVHGDLLSSFVRPVSNPGDLPKSMPLAASTTTTALNELREESMQRLKALRERPPANSVPSQFLALSERNKHAIAVDTSRSRLYLFENTSSGIKLIADYYISVGKLGIEKATEGDQRTPLGVYYITGSLNPSSLVDFYGVGALPINYPNALDLKRGKTGSGIWLHGTPSEQFSRAPKASDGCVVLSNPDLNHILTSVSTRTTPVVIAEHLNWVPKANLEVEKTNFTNTLMAWRQTKIQSDPAKLLSFYTPDFSNYGKNLTQWSSMLASELTKIKGHDIALNNINMMHWTDQNDTMIVTFDEVIAGIRTVVTKRQYWIRDGKTWKIFFEGII